MTDHTTISAPSSRVLEWAIPSRFRDADDLLMIRVEQDEAGAARVVVGPGAVWGDDRAEQTAATLREIADALDPAPVSATAGADEEGASA